MNVMAISGAMVIGFLIAVLVGSVIGAAFLRAGVGLYNMMAGGNKSKRAVPTPSFGKAMGIVLITWVVNMFTSFLIGLMFGFGGAAAGLRREMLTLSAQLVAIPIAVLIMASMLTALLPTTFGRAILVALCYMLVVILFVAILIVLIVAVGLVVGMASR